MGSSIKVRAIENTLADNEIRIQNIVCVKLVLFVDAGNIRALPGDNNTFKKRQKKRSDVTWLKSNTRT